MNIDEFYEDWKRETISWNAGGTLDDWDNSLTNKENIESINKVDKGSRASIGLDDSIEYYRHLQNARLDLIKSGGIKDVCIECKNIDTTFNFDDGTWTCNICNENWNPLKLIYRGM